MKCEVKQQKKTKKNKKKSALPYLALLLYVGYVTME